MGWVIDNYTLILSRDFGRSNYIDPKTQEIAQIWLTFGVVLISFAFSVLPLTAMQAPSKFTRLGDINRMGSEASNECLSPPALSRILHGWTIRHKKAGRRSSCVVAEIEVFDGQSVRRVRMLTWTPIIGG